METNQTWRLGVLWGAAAAAAASLLLGAAGLLEPEPTVRLPKVALLAAWWVATPACAALAASFPHNFRHLWTAIPWGVVCAVPWVAAIHVAAEGHTPSTIPAWTGLIARASVLGACAGIVAWRVLRPVLRPRSAKTASLNGRPARNTILIVSNRPELAEAARAGSEARASVRVALPGPDAESAAAAGSIATLLWDVQGDGAEELASLGRLMSGEHPPERTLLLDWDRSKRNVRIAPFTPGPRPVKLTYDVSVWRARWTTTPV